MTRTPASPGRCDRKHLTA